MMSEVRLRYVISKFGRDYVVANKQSSEITYHCPFCPSLGKRNDDRKLYVNVNKLLWHCKRCDSAGSLNQGSSDLYSVDMYNDIVRWLDPSSCREDEDMESDFYHIPEFKIVDYKDSIPYEYMKSRGFSDEDMEKYSIRISGVDEFIGRVVIPNKIISNNWTDMYSARSYVGHSNKYKNPSNSKKSRILFNYDNIPDNPDYMILNEGMLDSIIAGDFSVASFGKNLSNEQKRLIIQKNPKKLYVSFDSDAKDNAINVCDSIMNSSSITTYLVELPDDQDAVDLGRDKYHEMVFNTKPFVGKVLYNIFSNM